MEALQPNKDESTYQVGVSEGRALKGTEQTQVQLCGEEIQSRVGTKNGGAGLRIGSLAALKSISPCLAGSERWWLAQQDRRLHCQRASPQKEEYSMASWCVAQTAVAIAPGAASTPFPTRRGWLADLVAADAVLLTGRCSSHSSCSAACAVMRLHKGKWRARGAAW
jgi:hypothetical protein